MSLFSKIGRDVSIQVNARADDFVRMSKLLTSYQGAKFLANQALLRASNFNVENKSTIKQSAIDNVVDVSSVTASLLAQVAVNGTGTHFLSNELGAQMGKAPYFTGNSQAATDAKFGGRVNVIREGGKTLPEGKSSTSIESMHNMTATRSTSDDLYHDDFQSYMLPTTANDDPNREGVFLEDGTTEDNSLSKIVNKDTLPVIFSVVRGTHSTLPFRGFVNGINDSFSANWNTVEYVGRNEPLYIYNNTTRTLGFTLQVPIFSNKDTKRTYQRVNALMSYMYGRYGNSGAEDQNSKVTGGVIQGLNQGTVLRIRVGDYFRGYGIMTSLSHAIAQEVPWSGTNASQGDRRLTDSADRDLILPQVITLSLAFNIIHHTRPERIVGQEEASTLSFIGTRDITSIEKDEK